MSYLYLESSLRKKPMRITEVENSDNQKIDLLKKYFNFPHYSRYPYAGFTIDDNGGITVEGSCALSDIGASLEKLPIKFNYISGHFIITNCRLATLENCPVKIEGDFLCSGNQLTSLIGGPTIVNNTYDCSRNPLKSLDGIAEKIEGLFLTYNSTLPLLKVLQIKHLDYLAFEPSEPEIENILNKYIGQGRKGMILCAAELTKAGFKGNARL